MAKVVKLPKGREFEFVSGRQRGESRYDWDNWLNGDLLMLEQSTGKRDEKGDTIEVEDKKDYEVNTNQMVLKVKLAARQRYKVADVSRYDADRRRLTDAIIIRARPMTDEERDAEDARREEVKEKLREKKAEEKALTNGHADKPTASVGL